MPSLSSMSKRINSGFRQLVANRFFLVNEEYSVHVRLSVFLYAVMLFVVASCLSIRNTQCLTTIR
jgi:hypothetical protein